MLTVSQARSYDIAVQWASILTDEFSRQASLETDLKIPTSLAVAPTKASSLALAKSQIGFMKLFAVPLFGQIAEVMPEMAFGINEIEANLERWNAMIDDCNANGDKPFVVEKQEPRRGMTPVNGEYASDVKKSRRLSPALLDERPRISPPD